VAFCCAEFGVHASLPIYSGGLGILAGDILKEASDLGLPMVGVGLMYRTGYFHQRIDVTGYQHEYWLDADPERLPCVRVTAADGQALTVTVPVNGDDVVAQVWRVDVGRVPLYLLDTDRPENSPVGRWVTSRLYESNRAIRLAQYAVLGVGGVRALRAMGIQPGLYHLNEGHPALGVFELLDQARGRPPTGAEDAAWQRVREQVVFTTHTPVAAGNETYARDELLPMLGHIADLAGDRERFLGLGRIDPADRGQASGLTALALRACRHANAVSRRHGEVARGMWQPLFPGRAVEGVPIDHVTNGVHVPTWLQGPMRELLDRHLGPGWLARADQRETWAPVNEIPAAELWAARCAAREQLVGMITRRAIGDRLRRGDALGYASAAGSGFGFDKGRLTIGFARRLATYKRLHLVALMPERAIALVGGEHPVQFVFAGKAHPADDEAKEVVRRLFALKGAPSVAGHAAFLEDYDMALAGQLVAGCDLWVNLPRPPLEASGTSGMKSALGGGLQLSVLDGWWAEAYDGSNGWAIDGHVDADHPAQDWRDANTLFDLLEQQVVPMFDERDADGIPQRWVAMIRRSLMTNGPRFSATRMLREYADRIYGKR
jgi:starch phosphorylase